MIRVSRGPSLRRGPTGWDLSDRNRSHAALEQEHQGGLGRGGEEHPAQGLVQGTHPLNISSGSRSAACSLIS